MIRRWSYIKNIKINSIRFINFKFNYTLLTFKSSIIFKKLYFKNTKFYRKNLYKLKHKNNWLIYTQIFKYWTEDFIFTKTLIKYQTNNSLFNLNYLIFDYNKFVVNRSKHWQNVEFVIRFLPKKINNLYYLKNLHNWNIPLINAYCLNLNTIKNLNNENVINLLYLFSDNLYYSSLTNKNYLTILKINFELELLYTYQFKLTLKHLTILYNNLILLYLNILFKR